LVITDNTNCSLLRRESVPWYDVVIVNPEKEIPKNKVDVSKYHELRAEYESLAHEIIDDPFKVLTENGRHVASIIGMDDSVCREALEMGAVAAGVTGTGPAIAIVCEQSLTEEISRKFGNTIVCRVR
jgi:shikimate kinase